MARLIGEMPVHHGEIEFYDFVMKKVPDYVAVMFNVNFRAAGGVREADAILLVPHIGVFVVEVKASSYAYCVDGQIMLAFGKSFGRPSRAYRPAALKELRMITLEHLKEKFHITPFVYEIHCFPLLNPNDEVRESMKQVVGSELVLFQDDLVDSDSFLLKLMSCRAHLNKLKGFTDPGHDRQFKYSDLTDLMVYNIFTYWETGMLLPDRPAKPPFVFLSYNSMNQSMAEEIKKDLEGRGIYVWKAPEDVSIGGYYLPEEMEAIEACDTFIILMSSSSQESAEVKKEFVKARSLDKPIIPIVIEEFALNDYYREELTSYQYRKMTKLNNETMSEIVLFIRGLGK